MAKKDVLFWDVDTQFDFMQPEGKLYVPGAEEIIETVVRVRRFALENGYSIVASTDWHSWKDAEISDHPDFEKTFPAHCLAGQPGSQRVGEPADIAAEPIENKLYSDEQLKALIAKPPFHLVLRKNNLDVFTNPNTRRLLKLIQPVHIIVFGMVLDICVRMVVESFLKEISAKITVLKDAVKGIDPHRIEETLQMFRDNSVAWQTFEQIKDTL